MKAARLHAVGEALRLDDVDVPEPGRGEVRLQVKAAGICASDLHIIDGDTLLNGYPRTLGHEIAGVIDKVGDDDASVSVGERVCVDFLITCGECHFCRIGRESLCERRTGLGVARDGGFAEYVVVPARNVITIPDGVSFEIAAVATDALATPFHAISKRARIVAGEGAAVIGLGGLGLNAIRLLKFFGAFPIVGMDLDETSRARALEAGATAAFDPRDEGFAAWLSSGVLIKNAFDFVATPATVRQACSILGTAGRLVVIGHSRAPLELIAGDDFSRSELEVVGSYSFEREEIGQLLGLLARNELDISSSITHRMSLAEVNDGLTRLRTREGSPSRIVVIP